MLVFVGELELFLVVIDEKCFEVMFYCLGLLVYGRLSDVIYFGGFGKVFCFDEVGEDFKIFDLYGVVGFNVV